MAIAVIAPGCGDDSKDESSTQKAGPVPASLRTVESASEDIIDLALAGKRAEVVSKAGKLETAAKGLGSEELRIRAARVATLAPSAALLDVALASNRVFALVPGFFARYETSVPASITELDYLDFEAKLESRAHDTAKLRQAVDRLAAKWDSVRPQIDDARAAARFDAHVKAITALADNADPARTQREAQHGLDLVDELEQSFEG